MGGRAAAGLAVLALLAAGCGSADRPHFQSATGWRLLSGHDELAAANVDFATDDRTLASPPSRTVATLPRDGILIWTMLSRASRYSAGSTPLPLRLGEALPANPFEGFHCAPAVSTARCYAASGSVRRLGARVGSYYADVYVFFGTDRPGTATAADANAELARLEFPHARSSTAVAPACPTRAGAGAYATSISPSAGLPGSTVTVSGPLGVIEEGGTYVGQMASHVDAYWNLNFKKWWSVLGSSPSPVAAVARSPVRHLGTQDVARLCRYRLQVTVPRVRPGTYPIEVLYGDAKGGASFSPVDFRVTGG